MRLTDEKANHHSRSIFRHWLTRILHRVPKGEPPRRIVRARRNRLGLGELRVKLPAVAVQRAIADVDVEMIELAGQIDDRKRRFANLIRSGPLLQTVELHAGTAASGANSASGTER